MGCRCGQNKRTQPSGAATYSPPTPPPELRGMPAGLTVQAVDQVAPSEWYRVDVPDENGATASVWWATREDAIAFAEGKYPVKKTKTPPPQPVG